jgi:hypothetical protein
MEKFLEPTRWGEISVKTGLPIRPTLPKDVASFPGPNGIEFYQLKIGLAPRIEPRTARKLKTTPVRGGLAHIAQITVPSDIEPEQMGAYDRLVENFTDGTLAMERRQAVNLYHELIHARLRLESDPLWPSANKTNWKAFEAWRAPVFTAAFEQKRKAVLARLGTTEALETILEEKFAAMMSFKPFHIKVFNEEIAKKYAPKVRGDAEAVSELFDMLDKAHGETISSRPPNMSVFEFTQSLNRRPLPKPVPSQFQKSHPFVDMFRDEFSTWRPSPPPVPTFPSPPFPSSMVASSSFPTPSTYRPSFPTTNWQYPSSAFPYPIAHPPTEPFQPGYSQPDFGSTNDPLPSWNRTETSEPSSYQGAGWDPGQFAFNGLPDPVDHMDLPPQTFVQPTPIMVPPETGPYSDPVSTLDEPSFVQHGWDSGSME